MIDWDKQAKLKAEFEKLNRIVESKENSIMNRNIYGQITGLKVNVTRHEHKEHSPPLPYNEGKAARDAEKAALKAEIEAAREKEREENERGRGGARSIER